MADYKLRRRPKKIIDKKTILKDEDLRKRTRWAINYIADVRNLINETMALEMGVKIGTLANYRAMNTSPKVDFIKKFCEKYNFNETWFLKCEGEPFPGARQKYPEVCGPAEPAMVREAQAGYKSAAIGPDALFTPEQKINIEEAMGKAYVVLSAGTALSVALYMNIQQFAAALDAGEKLHRCEDELKALGHRVAELSAKVDRLTSPSTAERQEGAGSEKKAM